jgi:UDP-glucose:(heptosyl)LPS alpha-1,3-glucosyltransferase
MRVAILKPRSGQGGGLEKYTSRIAQAFLERGDQVNVLTTGPLQAKDQIQFYATNTVPWPAFVRMGQFDRFVKRWLEREQVDLVFGMERCTRQTHLRAGNGVHAAYLESRRWTEGALKVAMCKLNPLHQKILQFERQAFEYQGLKKLFTNSHMVRSQILERYKTAPEKVVVVHNGVEWKEMEADFANWEEKREEGLRRFGIERDLFHFLFIGHGYLRKGLERLLKGLSKLKRRDFHLSVIGKENRMDQFKAKAAQLGLERQVRFFGPSDEIRLFYQMADALVIPSFYDPFANVTVEAMAMGLFVVSSKQNGGHEVLTEECGAVIADLMDDEAMVEALEKAMERKKTFKSALRIRKCAEPLDFSRQLKILMGHCG